MQSLELKIPPLVVVIVFALAMWLVSMAVPAFQFSVPARHILALALAAAGVGLVISGAASFVRAKTTTSPMKPETATALVESGVYRFTRNPMYLGFLVVLLGWAAFLANVLAAVMLVGFVWYMTRFQIIPEERALSEQFGGAFSDYCKRVRRWL